MGANLPLIIWICLDEKQKSVYNESNIVTREFNRSEAIDDSPNKRTIQKMEGTN